MLDTLQMTQTIDLAKQHIERQKISGGIQDAKTPEAAGENFESFFVTHLLDQMFTGLGVDGLFGGGHAEKVYRGLLTQEYGKSIAKQGGIGVGKMITAELIRIQEDADQAAHAASALTSQSPEGSATPGPNPSDSTIR